MKSPMQNIMKMVGSMLPADIQPTNPVSRFIECEFTKLFGDNEDIVLIKTLSVQLSNDDPNAVLEKLVGLANDVSAFMAELNGAGDDDERD